MTALLHGGATRLVPDARPLYLPQKLIVLAVVASPFQKALTFDAGFPLKISEVLIVLAGGALVLQAHQQRRGPAHLRTQAGWLYGLGGTVVLSALVSLLRAQPPGPHPGYGRSLTTDLLLYVGYAAMVFVVWRTMLDIGSRLILDAMAWAVRLATVFCLLQWYLYETAQTSLIKALGFEMVIGEAYGTPIPRNGPFYEGNNLGVFAVLAALMMLRRRDRWGVAAALFCVGYSQSTTALLSLCAALAVAALLVASPQWRFRVVVTALLALAVTAAVPSARQFVEFQAAKVGISAGAGTADSGDRADVSRTVRGAKNGVAIDMALEHPVAGIGPGRYGAWFGEYADPADFPPGYTTGGPHRDSRRIVENGYAQIGAEVGLVGLFCFVMFLVGLGRVTVRAGFVELAITVAIVLLFFAAAAWTLLTLWFVLGYQAAVTREQGAARDAPAEPPTPSEALV